MRKHRNYVIGFALALLSHCALADTNNNNVKLAEDFDFANDLKTANSYELLYMQDYTTNEITRLQTSFIVPPEQPDVRSGVIFLWPGLESRPGAKNFEPIDNGVLQPVLTWGYSCAPTPQQQPGFSSWWISGQYVNTTDSDPDHSGCYSGDLMTVKAGDLLFMDIRLDQSNGVWTQTITNESTNEEVTFSINMEHQAQVTADFHIELYPPAIFNTPLVFLDTTITFANPTDVDCHYTGTSLTVSPPVLDSTKMNCTFDSIILQQHYN